MGALSLGTPRSLGSTLQGDICNTLASSYSSDIQFVGRGEVGVQTSTIPHVGYFLLVMLGQLHPAAKSLSTGGTVPNKLVSTNTLW